MRAIMICRKGDLLDCYGQHDIPGHPTSTFIIDLEPDLIDLNGVITELLKYYNRINKIESDNNNSSEGQSPQLLSLFLEENPSMMG